MTLPISQFQSAIQIGPLNGALDEQALQNALKSDSSAKGIIMPH